MPIRVMIVEDHAAWRGNVSSVLRRNCRYEIVAEVVDGLAAVAMAERLKPDLLGLDIGLPTLSGIEAARRIRAMAPDSRILFFTEQRSADVAGAALATGRMDTFSSRMRQTNCFQVSKRSSTASNYQR